jgi:hypothetical protein
MTWMQKLIMRDFDTDHDTARYTEALLDMRYRTLDWVGTQEIRTELNVVLHSQAHNDIEWLKELAESYAL